MRIPASLCVKYEKILKHLAIFHAVLEYFNEPRKSEEGNA